MTTDETKLPGCQEDVRRKGKAIDGVNHLDSIVLCSLKVVPRLGHSTLIRVASSHLPRPRLNVLHLLSYGAKPIWKMY